MAHTQYIRPSTAENAVRAIRLAAGLTPTLTTRDARRCRRLAEHCRKGLLTRPEITARLTLIAGGAR